MVQFCASRSNERLLENRPYNSISSSINTLQRLLHFVSIAQTILSNFVVVVIVVIVFVSSQYQQLCQYQFNLCAYREADIFVIQPSSQFCPISNNSHNTKSYGKKNCVKYQTKWTIENSSLNDIWYSRICQISARTSFEYRTNRWLNESNGEKSDKKNGNKINLVDEPILGTRSKLACYHWSGSAVRSAANFGKSTEITTNETNENGKENSQFHLNLNSFDCLFSCVEFEHYQHPVHTWSMFLKSFCNWYLDILSNFQLLLVVHCWLMCAVLFWLEQLSNF